MQENSQTTSENLETTAEVKTEPRLQIKFYEQVIYVEKLPEFRCKQCKGTGYLGGAFKKPQPKLPLGPNDKCVCGSEKKYKKCCASLVKRMRYSGASILTCSCVGKATLAENPELETLRKQMAKLNSMSV